MPASSRRVSWRLSRSLKELHYPQAHLGLLQDQTLQVGPEHRGDLGGLHRLGVGPLQLLARERHLPEDGSRLHHREGELTPIRGLLNILTLPLCSRKSLSERSCGPKKISPRCRRRSGSWPLRFSISSSVSGSKISTSERSLILSAFVSGNAKILRCTFAIERGILFCIPSSLL